MYEESARLMKEFPGIKIVAMGDMNDNPTDDSMFVYMHGREKVEEVGPGDFFSPFVSMLKAGYSSLYYRGENNIYDILVVNEALVNAPKGTLRIEEVLWPHLQPALHAAAGRPVCRPAAAHLLERRLRGRLQRPLPDLYCSK